MACFDSKRREIVLRIAYDGAATAGKTENLRALYAAATARSRGALVVPAETSTGRTLYFDWLELGVGTVLGWPLLCQIITVPGQLARSDRRYRLLRNLDAVVLVCESSPSGVRAASVARVFLSSALASLGDASVPIVVQANKQDLSGALTPAEVGARLGLDEGARVLGASAISQDGALATFLIALGKARERVREVIRGKGAEALPPPQGTSQELYNALLAAEETGPESAAGEALEAALASFADE